MTSDEGDSSAKAGSRAPLTTLGKRISSRPPPPPESVEASSVPYEQLLANLAAAEVEEFTDPDMQIRGKPLPVRVSWRAQRAVGALLRHWASLALAALRRWGTLALAALREALPKARRTLWARRRELGVVALSVAGLFVAAALLRTHASRGLRAVATEVHVVTDGLIDLGARFHHLAEIVLTEPAPPPEPVVTPSRPDRYLLSVVSVPAGASVTVAGQRFRTPVELEFEALESPLDVRVQKWGHVPVTRSIAEDAFELSGKTMRHTMEVVLEPVSGARKREAGTARTARTPARARLPAREALIDVSTSGRTPLADRPAPEREAIPDRPAPGTRAPAPAVKPANAVPSDPF